MPAPAFIPCPTVYPERKIWEAGNMTDQPSRIEHNVPCGGHLRQCDICGEVRYCGREGRCLDANQHLAAPGLRLGNVDHTETGLRLGLDDGAHDGADYELRGSLHR